MCLCGVSLAYLNGYYNFFLLHFDAARQHPAQSTTIQSNFHARRLLVWFVLLLLVPLAGHAIKTVNIFMCSARTPMYTLPHSGAAAAIYK